LFKRLSPYFRKAQTKKREIARVWVIKLPFTQQICEDRLGGESEVFYLQGGQRGGGQSHAARNSEKGVWMRNAVALSNGDFYINIPDIIENLDILSAMRGPQELCCDIIEYPELVRTGVDKIDGVYFKYYDGFYNIVKDVDGGNSFTGFNILGGGKVAKLQCDFSAMISPDMFRKYVQPSLRKQCQKLEHSIYHLDGPDAIKHLDALMEIDELDAVQWQFTCGPGQLDGGDEKWFSIYDKVRKANKGLSITLSNGTPDDWTKSAKRIVNRYGMEGIYFLFPEFPDLESACKMAETFG